MCVEGNGREYGHGIVWGVCTFGDAMTDHPGSSVQSSEHIKMWIGTFKTQTHESTQKHMNAHFPQRAHKYNCIQNSYVYFTNVAFVINKIDNNNAPSHNSQRQQQVQQDSESENSALGLKSVQLYKNWGTK